MINIWRFITFPQDPRGPSLSVIITFQLTALLHVLPRLGLAMTQRLVTGMYGYGLAVVECCSEIARSENRERETTFCPNNFRKAFVVNKCCVWRISVGIFVYLTKSGWNRASKLRYSVSLWLAVGHPRHVSSPPQIARHQQTFRDGTKEFDPPHWLITISDLRFCRLDEGRKLNVIKISVLLLTGKLGTVCQYVWCWGYGLYDRRIGVRFPEWEDICLFPRGSTPALGPTTLKPYMIGRFFGEGGQGLKLTFTLI